MLNNNTLHITIYSESTPNPGVMKFVCNKQILFSSPIEFLNANEGKNNFIAKKLFLLPIVKEVFIAKNFVSITKHNSFLWEEYIDNIKEEIKIILTEYLNSTKSEEPDILPKKTSIKTKETNLNATEKKIIEILDDYVKPAVESDGGNIKFISFSEGTVSVLLQGACSGCPSSVITLKNGIETLLKNMIGDDVKNVEAING
ncbi:MAG: NifU family protein [Flavobacteriales bacterium TMED288]|nr:hypothetical protein [Flavobacteriales bacterium]RPG53061.1 MAG: NifU family protein [Flavobacteriales bacterium TMED288]|tara:strand:+ start:3406 stop:4008 length:603 start_codon:yes stop_codon:yes gene_type:complete